MTREQDWLEGGNARILKQPLVFQPAGFKARVILREVAESKNKTPIVGISGFHDSARNDGGTGLAEE